jgi:hypothetical protein
MWDKYSITRALDDQGFVDIQPFVKNKCENDMFLIVEEEYQFLDAITIQCRKPHMAENS